METKTNAPDTHEGFLQEWQVQTEYLGKSQILAEAFKNSKAVAVSDGSYREVMGTAAWTIEGRSSEDQIVSIGYTPGSEMDQSAYWSELFRLWGILFMTLRFIKDNNITQGAVTIACDGLSALKQAQYRGPTDPNTAHYDIISAIRSIRDKLPKDITFEHVQGHQDNGQSLALSRVAWMNIEMDGRAKERAMIPHQGPTGYTIPYEGWQCGIQGQRLTKHLQTKLRDYINGITIQQHWSKKNWYGKGTASMVDWEAANQAMRALPQAQQRWVAKSAAKFLPDGKNMTQWKLWTSAKCPRCPELNETKNHIFQCQATDSRQQWETALQGLDDWLQVQNTQPGLRQEIITGLRRWQTGETDTVEFTMAAAQEQSLLGWGMMLEGVISMKWHEMQATYWKVYKSRKSSKWWTTALIKKLLQIAWDMWHHRNHALHNSPTNREQILEGKTNQRIRVIYEQGPGSFPRDAISLLKRTQSELITLPLAYKKQWIETALIAQKRRAKQLAGPYQRERKYMQTWAIRLETNNTAIR